MKIKMNITAFWDITPCWMVICYGRFGISCCFHLQKVEEEYVEGKWLVPPKLWQQTANQYGVMSQKTVIFFNNDAKTSNHTKNSDVMQIYLKQMAHYHSRNKSRFASILSSIVLCQM